MFRQLLPFAICLALFVIPIAYSDNEKPITKPNVKDLYSQEARKARHTYDTFVQQRNADIQALIAILRDKDADPDFDGPKNCAVELLGEYRAVEAIDPLMENLFYAPRPHVIDHAQCREAYYTCAVALEKIGSPCLNKIYLRMPKAKKEEQQLLAWIVEGILQKDEAMAALEFQKQQAGKENQQVFADAVEYLKNYKPDFTPPFKVDWTFPPAGGTTPPTNGGTTPPAEPKPAPPAEGGTKSAPDKDAKP
jgi:hypothetical protein